MLEKAEGEFGAASQARAHIQHPELIVLHLKHAILHHRLVFTAGNADTFSRVLLTLKLLRNHYNTSLPAEIFSFPGEMPPPDLLDEFAKYNATLRVVSLHCILFPRFQNANLSVPSLLD